MGGKLTLSLSKILAAFELQGRWLGADTSNLESYNQKLVNVRSHECFCERNSPALETAEAAALMPETALPEAAEAPELAEPEADSRAAAAARLTGVGAAEAP